VKLKEGGGGGARFDLGADEESKDRLEGGEMEKDKAGGGRGASDEDEGTGACIR
jgi:hypothetical protein